MTILGVLIALYCILDEEFGDMGYLIFFGGILILYSLAAV